MLADDILALRKAKELSLLLISRDDVIFEAFNLTHKLATAILLKSHLEMKALDYRSSEMIIEAVATLSIKTSELPEQAKIKDMHEFRLRWLDYCDALETFLEAIESYE